MSRATPEQTNIRPAATDTPGAANYTTYSVAHLKAARRGLCDGPPYVRVGRSIRYLIRDLDVWLEQRRIGGDR